MTKEEFITIVQRCGYGTKKSAKKYVEKNPKEEYDTNDLITLYEGSMHNIVGAIFIAVLGIAIFMCKSPLDDQRIKARNDLKYDDYGRVKISNQYEKMSAREQAEIDRINQLEMERTLPSSIVRSMTHEGSKHGCDPRNARYLS